MERPKVRTIDVFDGVFDEMNCVGSTIDFYANDSASDPSPSPSPSLSDSSEDCSVEEITRKIEFETDKIRGILKDYNGDKNCREYGKSRDNMLNEHEDGSLGKRVKCEECREKWNGKYDGKCDGKCRDSMVEAGTRLLSPHTLSPIIRTLEAEREISGKDKLDDGTPLWLLQEEEELLGRLIKLEDLREEIIKRSNIERFRKKLYSQGM